MDNTNRNYYMVKFKYVYKDYRIKEIKVACQSAKFFHKECTTTLMISVKREEHEALEYELMKADRRDGLCKWYQIYSGKDIKMKMIFGGRMIIE